MALDLEKAAFEGDHQREGRLRAAELKTRSEALTHSVNARWLARSARSTGKPSVLLLSLGLLMVWLIASSLPVIKEHLDSLSKPRSDFEVGSFFHSAVRGDGLCPGVNIASSYAGYIGLKTDNETVPRRSFYWLFDAEDNADNAPIIFTIGGGPGSSGLLNPMFGQSPCIMMQNGTAPNPHRWTEKFNLLALDHPVGTGYSYGALVNNSRDAAYDAYDFFQKFFALYPKLANNKLILASGSYGGTYLPHIATVIQEQNDAIAQGTGPLGAIHINLESITISNPASDPVSWMRWMLYYNCELHDVYNSTTCAELYPLLPACLESIEYALEFSTPETRHHALHACTKLVEGDRHGRVLQDIRRTCDSDDLGVCHPQLVWAADFFSSNSTKAALGIPDFVTFQSVNLDVYSQFVAYGDHVLRHHKLYEPLIARGIRVLHHVGMWDASCSWPGTFSFLKLLNTPFSSAFSAAEDIPWPSKESPAGTVRTTGAGSGNFTFLTYAEAGHFIVWDQNAQTKYVMEHWIENVPFVEG